MVGIEMKIMDYQDSLFGGKIKGFLNRNDSIEREFAYYWLCERLDQSDVAIPESLTVYIPEFHIIESPNREPRAEYWTPATVRVFPNVPEEHRHSVRRFGIENHVVRVPISEPINLRYNA